MDFTISFGEKTWQPSTVTYKDGSTFSIDYRLALRKSDFISIQKVSQEGNTLHQIYHIEFGNLPYWSMLSSLNDWLLKAGLDYEDGNYCGAINLYSMLLSEFELSDDVRVGILVNLGLSYVGIEKYNWAIDSYKKAIKIELDEAIIWNNLGIAYEKIGDKKKAKKAFKKANITNKVINSKK